jgi:hypothetical protein
MQTTRMRDLEVEPGRNRFATLLEDIAKIASSSALS